MEDAQMLLSVLSLAFPLQAATAPTAALPDIRFTYEIRLEGRQICGGTQVVELGKAVEVCTRHYNETTVKFRAKVKAINDHQFLVSGSVSEYEKDGMPKSLSAPQISAIANERAEISIADQDDKEQLSMAVLVSP